MWARMELQTQRPVVSLRRLADRLIPADGGRLVKKQQHNSRASKTRLQESEAPVEISLEAGQDFRHVGTGYCSFFNTLFPVFGGAVGGVGGGGARIRDPAEATDQNQLRGDR